MGCGCQGSGAKRATPPPRDRRGNVPPPPTGPQQGAVGSKGYYYEGPERAPKTES